MKSGCITLLVSTIFTSTAGAQLLPDIRIMDTDVFPESISAGADGTIYAGSVKGNVYRAAPGAGQAHAWIRHSAENGILTILGVLADDAHQTLWLCSVPNAFGPERSDGVSALKAFDLATGSLKASYNFPAPASACNDVTVAGDGTAYASDTPNGRIFSVAPGASTMTLVGEDPELVGIDGIVMGGDGTLYANNVRSQKIYRIGINPEGRMNTITALEVSHALGGPDGMRLVRGNRFLQAESSIGRLSIVDINGDKATMTILRDDLLSSPGATVVGNTAYVIESNIAYLFNPDLRGQEPPPFMLYAVPLP
jgi:sugar lactone lactonase YvrE